MPIIKLEYVVSCSSEDLGYAANNLLNNDTNKRWKCKTTGEPTISIIFQLEKCYKISGIDIGNENSSFVEVLVGRSSAQDQDYQILLAMCSFMTPMEARNLTNSNRVRMFTYNELVSPARDEKWDRVKVVCTQPFNKHVQYGLSFINLHTPQEHKSEDIKLGKFTLRPESPILPTGSLFAKRKEITEDKNMTITEAIRSMDKPPPRKPIIIKPSASTSSKTNLSINKEEKNRNRENLFYDSDDEKPHEKIDKVVEKVKQEQKVKMENTTPNKKKNEDKSNTKNKPNSSNKKEKVSALNSLNTTKRKLDTTPSTTKKKAKLVTKPFNELLSGVVFTISGIVNPERANLRQLALNMGAKYRPDWDDTCTHLICAYANTPKFQQVQGIGKIVTKLWVKDCHDQRKRLPWRRYALDRNDQGMPESENEIEETIDEPEELNTNDEKSMDNYLLGSDTDEEIEKILVKQKANVEDSKKNDVYNVDTDEEVLEKTPVEIKEEIPKLFKTEIFYIDDVFEEEEKNKLHRLIVAFDGVVLNSLRSIVDFIITNEDSAEKMKKQCSTAKCVKPLWIYECHDMLKFISYEKFLLT